MLIGQLAKQAGVKVETVRYYERRGLLAAPQRTTSGYRRYPDDALATLRFIKRAQRLGFSLHDIEELLSVRNHPAAACDAVDRKTRETLSLVRQKISELRDMERSLAALADGCDRARPASECAILQELELDGSICGHCDTH